MPNYSELSSKRIWRELGNDPIISQYFPAYSKSRAPNKQYLLNIVNTIRPDSISKIVQTLKNKRSLQ